MFECGARHSIILDTSGGVYVFGDNTHGQCLSRDMNVKEPKRIGNLDLKCSLVGAGRTHSVGVSMNDQSVYQWGGKDPFQLDQSQTHRIENQITKLEVLVSTKMIGVGENNTLIVIN